MANKRRILSARPRAPRLAAGVAAVAVLALLAAVAVLALLAAVVAAQPSGNYDLSWYAFDNGGGPTAGSQYALANTLGEPLAGWALGAQHGMGGGYAPGAPYRAPYRTYLPIVVRVRP